MNEFRAKMAENGRIIIPAALRQQMHLKPGEELILRIEDDELRLFTLEHSLRKAQALVRQRAKKKSLVKELKKMRQQDSINE